MSKMIFVNLPVRDLKASTVFYTALGGEMNYLTPGEGAKADATNLVVIDRIWNLWKLRVTPALAK